MATLSKINNARRIQWTTSTGSRPTIWLGRCDKKQAETIRLHVDRLLQQQKLGGSLPTETVAWLANVGPVLRERMENAGLIPASKPPASRLIGEVVQAYIDRRTDLKPMSINTLKQTRRALVAFFGEGRDIATINPGDAADFKRKVDEDYAEATVAMFIKKAKQIFADAIDREIVTVNPFRKIKGGSQVNKERIQFVPAGDIEKVLDACPDDQWRLIFALSRYGGLRCPSEIMLLKWSDIIWDQSRFVVRIPKKTKKGKIEVTRIVPIFPELMPMLLKAQSDAPVGEERVIHQHRITNNRTTAHKIVERAGVRTWPKLFHNLRASRQTELTARFPLHVVCVWLGNSPEVARRHYLSVTEQDFARALQPALRHPAESTGNHGAGAELAASGPAHSDKSALGGSIWGDAELAQLHYDLTSREGALRKVLRQRMAELARSDALSLAHLAHQISVAHQHAQGGGGSHE